MNKIVFLDGYNLIHRSRAGFAKGDNAITYTFFRSLRSLVERLDPDQAYFVLEGKPVKRLQLDKQYKANRKRVVDMSFYRQKDDIIEIMKRHFPIDVVRHPYHECDDVIAGLITQRHVNDECIVVSSDTDFLQLYNTCENVEVYNPIQKKVRQKPPYDYVSWKALRGDSADNIPGFSGIGDKRATTLITDPDRLHDFLSADGNRSLFEHNCEMIRFHDFSHDINYIEQNRGNSNWPEVLQKFNEMEFFSITNQKSWNKFFNTFDKLT